MVEKSLFLASLGETHQRGDPDKNLVLGVMYLDGPYNIVLKSIKGHGWSFKWEGEPSNMNQVMVLSWMNRRIEKKFPLKCPTFLWYVVGVKCQQCFCFWLRCRWQCRLLHHEGGIMGRKKTSHPIRECIHIEFKIHVSTPFHIWFFISNNRMWGMTWGSRVHLHSPRVHVWLLQIFLWQIKDYRATQLLSPACVTEWEWPLLAHTRSMIILLLSIYLLLK